MTTKTTKRTLEEADNEFGKSPDYWLTLLKICRDNDEAALTVIDRIMSYGERHGI